MIDKDGTPDDGKRPAEGAKGYSINTLKTKAYNRSAAVLAGFGKVQGQAATRLTQIIAQIEWPADCCLCREPDTDGAICKVCQELLSENLNACRSCAYPVLRGETGHQLTGETPVSPDQSVSPENCAECLVSSPAFRFAAVPYLYRFPVDQLVLALKYRDATGIARAMARLMCESDSLLHLMEKQRPDFLVPIPLEPTRFHHRGFNQASQIAGWLSRYTGYPVRSASLLRNVRKNVPSQTMLGRQSRLDAFHGDSANGSDTAFRASDVHGLNLLLVDDVMTTGATFRAATDTLLDAGASSVGVCAFARTTH